MGKKDFWKGVLTGALVMALLLTGINFSVIGYRLLKPRESSGTRAESGSVIDGQMLQKVKAIEETIDSYFYYGDEVTTAELKDGIYSGMIKALGDQYSEYYTKEDLVDSENKHEGISYGIGVTISIDQELNMPAVVLVAEDSPAKEAGLKEGDIIYKVEEEGTQGLTISQVAAMVKGREDTVVHLTIYRQSAEGSSGEYIEVDVTRKNVIETITVDSGMLKENEEIGYIRIRSFDSATVDQFAEALAQLREEDMKALVLDLRGNLGGDLNAVVEIARKILPEGLITSTEDKQGNRKEYTCDGTGELDVPLAVLINGYSASAAELLSGAIQDHNKGTLIGTTTYGKGIVQKIYSFNDGTAVKLTNSAWFTPSGRNIQGTGIEPDIEVEYDRELAESQEIDNQVAKAVEILEGKMA